jgi:hypothetical protein
MMEAKITQATNLSPFSSSDKQRDGVEKVANEGLLPSLTT